MKKFFDHLCHANSQCKFVKKKPHKQKFKNQPFTIIISSIFLILCLIVAVNLYVAEQQTPNNTLMCQFTLISLEASARLLYSDLERRVKKETEKHKSQKNSTAATSVWIALEVVILCVIVVVILDLLKQLAPSAPSFQEFTEPFSLTVLSRWINGKLGQFPKL